MAAIDRTAASAASQGWFQRLVPVDWNRLGDLTNEPVPNHLKRWWFCLGGTPAYLFIIQILSGLLMLFYYVPSPEQAYASVSAITNELRFGWFIRSLHKWSANFMIIAVFLHMLRVFFTGAYRRPRQLNWLVGSLLFLVTLGP